MASTPVFGADDRVARPLAPATNQTTLPAELRGETDPLKIAAYYQRRETAIREELRQTPPTPTRGTVTITRETENRPPVTEGEIESFRVTGIENAKALAKSGKKYWDKFEADINGVMEKMDRESLLNYKTWEVAYNTIVGMNMDKIRTDEAADAANQTRLAAERSSTPSSDQPPPPPLDTKVTSKILPGLGVTEDNYRLAQSRMEKGEWPLTSENVNGKRVTIGGGK